MNARAWGKLTLGVGLIGGILAGLWAIYGPRTAGPPDDRRPPLPRLADARAIIHVRDASGTRRAFVSCHGDRRRASGFWAGAPAEACDALASTRTALLAGPGCARLEPGQVGIAARGRFGARRFAHRAVRGGCPDPEGWLAVEALGSPVLEPDREIEDAGQALAGTPGGPAQLTRTSPADR
jgi:hypothetical protein